MSIPAPSQSPLSRKRQIENEVVFRTANEKVQHDLNELRNALEAENKDLAVSEKELTLHFYCECSDENCHQRIPMKLENYAKMHKDRRNFILIPGHESKSIEKVVKAKTRYNLVKKFITPPEFADELRPTNINNA